MARTRRSGNYVYGTAARRLDVQRQMEMAPRKPLSTEARKNRDKARHMSVGYVMFLVAALCVSAVILINYIQLQAELTGAINQVAKLESQLNNQRLANDEEYNRILNSIDLEEVRRIAIGELGMVYAKEDQVITYTGGGRDYMRKVTEEEN